MAQKTHWRIKYTGQIFKKINKLTGFKNKCHVACFRLIFVTVKYLGFLKIS